MTWIVSISAPTRAQAKAEVTTALLQQIAPQSSHAHDAKVLIDLFHGAIDALGEGEISVAGSGYASTAMDRRGVPVATSISISAFGAYSTAQPNV